MPSASYRPFRGKSWTIASHWSDDNRLSSLPRNGTPLISPVTMRWVSPPNIRRSKSSLSKILDDFIGLGIFGPERAGSGVDFGMLSHKLWKQCLKYASTYDPTRSALVSSRLVLTVQFRDGSGWAVKEIVSADWPTSSAELPPCRDNSAHTAALCTSPPVTPRSRAIRIISAITGRYRRWDTACCSASNPSQRRESPDLDPRSHRTGSSVRTCRVRYCPSAASVCASLAALAQSIHNALPYCFVLADAI